MSESPDTLKVNAFNRRFIGFIAKHPFAAIFLSLSLVVGLAAGLGKLKADFTHTGFFRSDDPMLKRFEAFERKFGNDDAVLIGIQSPSGIFDMDTAQLVREATDAMWKIPEVIRVDSLANFNWVHAQGDDILVEPLFPDVLTPEILSERKKIALAHEVLPNYLVNKEGTVTMLYARIKPGLEKAADHRAITSAAEAIATKLRRGDHEVHIGGNPPVTAAFETVSQTDISRLIPLAIAIAVFFLAILLRSVWGVVLPLVVVLTSALSAFGLAGWAGLTQTAMSTAIPTILIAVGIADTVHVLVTFIGLMRSGMPQKQAAHQALTKNLLATFLTGVTTAVGFLSFMSANLKPLSTLGIMTAFGTLMAWLLTQMLVGGLLFVLPFRLKPLPPERLANNERRAHNLVNFIIRRRFRVIGFSVVFTAATLVYSLGLDINSDPLKYFAKGTPIRASNEFVERTMGAARSFEMVIEAGSEDGVKDPAFLKKVDAFQTWLEKQPRMTRAVSILDVLKQTHRSLNGGKAEEYRIADSREAIAQELFLYTMGLPQGMDLNDRVSVKNDALRMTVLNNIITSREAVRAIGEVVAYGKGMGLNVEATGKYYLYQYSNEYVVSSFVTSLWSASLVIGLIMAFFLRSVKLGLISMIPNVVPLFAGGSLLRLIGQPLDMGTAIVASISLGISVDDTCHVLANFAYLRRNGVAPNDAMRSVINHAGPALLSTNGILIAAFASFVTATFVPNFYFGILTAFILAVALVADMFLTPAMVVVAAEKDPTMARMSVAPGSVPAAVPAE